MLCRAAFQNTFTGQFVPCRIGSFVAVPQASYVGLRRKCSHTTLKAATGSLPPSELPEDIVDLRDPQLLEQINDLLQELDPDMLLVRLLCFGMLLHASLAAGAAAAAAAAAAGNLILIPWLLCACLQDDTSLLMQQPLVDPLQAEGAQQQQQQHAEKASSSFGGTATTDAWQGGSGDEETEAGMPGNIVLVNVQLHQCCHRSSECLLPSLPACFTCSQRQQVVQVVQHCLSH